MDDQNVQIYVDISNWFAWVALGLFCMALPALVVAVLAYQGMKDDEGVGDDGGVDAVSLPVHKSMPIGTIAVPKHIEGSLQWVPFQGSVTVDQLNQFKHLSVAVLNQGKTAVVTGKISTGPDEMTGEIGGETAFYVFSVDVYGNLSNMVTTPVPQVITWERGEWQASAALASSDGKHVIFAAQKSGGGGCVATFLTVNPETNLLSGSPAMTVYFGNTGKDRCNGLVMNRLQKGRYGVCYFDNDQSDEYFFTLLSLDPTGLPQASPEIQLTGKDQTITDPEDYYSMAPLGENNVVFFIVNALGGWLVSYKCPDMAASTQNFVLPCFEGNEKAESRPRIAQLGPDGLYVLASVTSSTVATASIVKILPDTSTFEVVTIPTFLPVWPQCSTLQLIPMSNNRVVCSVSHSISGKGSDLVQLTLNKEENILQATFMLSADFEDNMPVSMQGDSFEDDWRLLYVHTDLSKGTFLHTIDLSTVIDLTTTVGGRGIPSTTAEKGLLPGGAEIVPLGMGTNNFVQSVTTSLGYAYVDEKHLLQFRNVSGTVSQ
jgi:hypothetical protein